MYVLAFCNFKGGVGKTNLSAMLAVGLARSGLRVLLVDLDANADASKWMLGPAWAEGLPGVAEALLGARSPRDEELHASPHAEGLTVLPASQALNMVSVVLPSRTSQETTLRRVLAPLASRFQVVVVDCPPTRGPLGVNGLAAASGVLVPFKADKFSLDALLQLRAALVEVRELLNPGVHLLGQVLFAADPRTVSVRQVREALGADGDTLFRACIRSSEPGAQMATHGRTAWDKGADARVAADYQAVMAELLARVEAVQQGRAVA